MKKFTLSSAIFIFLFVFSSFAQQSDLKIDYEKYTLPNGLDVILSIDRSDPIVALAVQYHVGSNREVEGKTGFAHLFEHMMFQQSENVGNDQYFQLIQNAGGDLNGGTSYDATTYYETVPNNALELILWLESDRMGYMINTVTENSFNVQQNVVQNEKRQRVDNRPYGQTQTVIASNLYPKGHPYSWTVIGEMEDLMNASIEDVKEFHSKFYLPNNATIVLAGDFDVAEAKKLIEKYFGEIKRGSMVPDPRPMPIKLSETKKVFYEDNFARAAQFRMIWPTVEDNNSDNYALSYLAELLSQGKKAPLYNVLEKEKHLTSSQYAYNSSMELAGTFNIVVTANEGIDLDSVERGIFEAFSRFETQGFTQDDIERIKAGLETDFYNNISNVMSKAFQLAYYNEYKGNPGYYLTDIEKLKSVTKEDVLRVFNQYIKNKPYLATSFVPRDQLDFIVDGSTLASIKEEKVVGSDEVKISEEVDVAIEKTPTSFDRSIQPADGPDPLLKLPTVWRSELKNEMKVFGIQQNELPLVQFNIIVKGGHFLDQPGKEGVANLVAEMMIEGTKNKTPLELEEEIEKLGASISISASNNAIVITANSLTRNFEQTLALVEEIVLEPRWDAEEFEMAKTRITNQLIRQKADPNALANKAFNRLAYGADHIFSVDKNGTLQTIDTISIEDLKAFYESYFSPSVASFLVAGNIDQENVVRSLGSLGKKWKVKNVFFPKYTLPAPLDTSAIFFVDVPGAKQSVISIGYLALSRTDPDFFPATVMNYKLGGSFNGVVNMVLREEKGFTYGARTFFNGSNIPGPFLATASVKSSATFESVQIFKDLMQQHRNGITEEELTFTKNSMIKSNALEFETLGALLGMLQNISLYNFPDNFIEQQNEIVRNMQLDRIKELAEKYIIPGKMFYVVAGDAATQLEPLKAIGFGEPVIISE